jgi:hypothetical protein
MDEYRLKVIAVYHIYKMRNNGKVEDIMYILELLKEVWQVFDYASYNLFNRINWRGDGRATRTAPPRAGRSVESCKAGLSNAAAVIYFPGALIYSAGLNVNQNFRISRKNISE